MRMSLKKHSFLTLVALLLVSCIALSGCENFSKKTTMEESEQGHEADIVVGFSQIGSESLWRTANTNSIQNSLSKEHGYFLLFKNARQKQENQIKEIREFISQRVDYIIFSPVCETGWESVLQEAKNAGIPVILIDRNVSVSEDDLYTTWVGSDMYEEGRSAGEWLEGQQSELNPDEENINIVVLKGTSGSTATIGRTEGFHDIAKKHPNWNILAEEYADYTTAKGKEIMSGFLERYDKIDYVISQNDDMTFGAIDAMEQAGRTYGTDGEIKIVSFDATKAGLILVRDGKVELNVECNPLQGPYVELIIQRLEDGFSVNKRNYVTEDLFTKDNVIEALNKRTY